MNRMALPNSALAVAAAALLAGAGAGWAHGSLHEQLTAVNAQLEKQPANAELLLWRADLRRQHQQWEEATHDIAEAQRAGATAGELAMARTQLAVSRGDWEVAARELPLLARELPQNAEAWRIAATVESARSRHAAAAAAWRMAADRAQPPRPDDFISLARASRAAGADDGAIAALDAGIAQLGEASALIEEAAGIEEALQRWDAALARIARLAAAAPNPARWLARRGDLAEKAGRSADATEARRAALAAFDALPPARRNVPAMSELADRLRARLGLPRSAGPPQ